MRIRKKYQIRCRCDLKSLILIFVVIFSLISGCEVKNSPANYFFEGAYLRAAEAIDLGDMKSLDNAVREIDVNGRGRDGITLLFYAILNNSFSAITVLVRSGSDVSGQRLDGVGSPLDIILEKSDVRFLQAALDGGLSPDYKNPMNSGGSAMLGRVAGVQDSIDKVRFLVARGANLDSRDGVGNTPVMEAVDSYSYEVAEFLLLSGASVDCANDLGVTLAWSVDFVINRQQPGSPVRRGFERVRELMIKRGAKFPPDSPELVREQMRRQGLEPVVPAGHLR